MAATLHIHVMRNTFFGVIVTAWCACHLSTGGPQATDLERCAVSFFRRPLDEGALLEMQSKRHISGAPEAVSLTAQNLKSEARRIGVSARRNIDFNHRDDFETTHATSQRQMFKACNRRGRDCRDSDVRVRKFAIHWRAGRVLSRLAVLYRRGRRAHGRHLSDSQALTGRQSDGTFSRGVSHACRIPRARCLVDVLPTLNLCRVDEWRPQPAGHRRENGRPS